MRTGECRYGEQCRFDHPADRASAVQQGPPPERPGEPDCQFFLKTGTCKYGATCKYNHPANGAQPAMHSGQLAGAAGPEGQSTTFNSAGYPLHEGQPDCDFYMHRAECK